MSQPRVAHFCPMCGTAFVEQPRNGAPRPVCPNCDYTMYFDPKVAVAVLILQGEQVLLIKRAHAPKQGFWALPAGFVDAGEDPQAAGSREALEETGLIVQIERLLDVFHTPDDGGLADIVIVYAARMIGGRLQPDDDAEAAAWFSADAIPPLAFLPSQQVIARWQAGLYAD
jgi:ADP-ribose pyrophosphatase YjhB (NUDIX family)